MIAYLTSAEVFDLVIIKGLDKEQFLEWVDQKAWDDANHCLEDDVACLELEEGEVAEKAKEAINTEVWGDFIHI